MEDKQNVEIVTLNEGHCTCRKWQLSGLPCGHVIAVSISLGMGTCFPWAKDSFKKTTLRDTYQELVYPLKATSSWETPEDMQKVLPPSMEKRNSGRPKNRDRFPSRGESRKRTPCSTCGNMGHKSMSCKGPTNIQLKRQQNIRKVSFIFLFNV